MSLTLAPWQRLRNAAVALQAASRGRSGPWRGQLLACLCLVWLAAGCYETEFYPLAADGADSADSQAVDSGSGADDSNADSAADDTASDSSTADSARTDVAEDDGAGSADGESDTADDTTDDADDGADDGAAGLLAMGATCNDDQECATGICLSVSGDSKVCSQPCTGDCPAGMRCGIDPATGSTSVPFCLPLPGSLCKPCSNDSDCSGGPCVPLSSSKESLCGVNCGPGGSCPSGFVCQSFVAGEVCVPQLGTCTCSGGVLAQQWSCQTVTKVGACNGVQTCTDSGWTPCSAPVPSPELCDGADNDCNGATDEAYANLGQPCGVGACAGGKRVCSADKKGAVCSTELKKPAKDLCGNGIDDNCDGKTDEACPPKDTDKDGTPDLSDCQPYLAEYRPGVVEPCCGSLKLSGGEVAVDASTAICDFNCNGKVSPCAEADADKDGFGPPEDCDDKSAAVHPGAADKCADGIDQDCDGSDALCDEGNDGDGDGWPIPYDCQDSTEKIFPGAKELCNNIDDDCDGITDDGNPGGGAACGVSQGACKAGTVVCTAVGLAKTATLACVDQVGGEAETCNGKDDNCDGKTDETFFDLGLGSPCDTDDSDQCGNGIQACQADGTSLGCPSEKVYDLVEKCKAPGQGNQIDEDCDGQTDEVCWGADLDGDGVVGATDCNEQDAGYSPKIKDEACCDPSGGMTEEQAKVCDRNCDGQVAWCDPADLDKDGYVDDDCNPQDPKSHPGAAEACGDGIDQDCTDGDIDCATLAEEDADGDKYGNAVDCSPFDAAVNPGAVEVCNGKDDDCNGVVDDGNPGGGASCGTSVGVCKPGATVCTKVGFKPQILCIPQKAPAAELCNGLDDNCNGKTDEYFGKLGQACDGPDTDACQNGVWTCSPDGKGEVCSSESVANIVELCDGLDNDCDGKTDEDLTYFGKPLGATCKGLGACGLGTVVCSPELQVPVCSTDFYGTTPESSAETCNGKDDDCDGLIDEGQTFGGKKLGEACVGPGVCEGTPGKVECGPAGTAICSTMAGGSKPAGKTEQCNGIDDDCDGHIDEGLTVANSTCKQTGVCSGGSVMAKCKGGAWQCSYTAVDGFQPDKEYSCDGLDNDCDGQTDEDFKIGEACDGNDLDQCKTGTWTCSGDKGGAICVNEIKQNINELCNGEDDDCDGQTDEGFDVGVPCDGPDSDACKLGTKQCTADGEATVCGVETKANITESCNGSDDDCDGEVDEDFSFGQAKLALGAACDGPDSDLCSNGVVVCASNGLAAVCGTETKQDIKEDCDGLDNNCNGKVDENLTYNEKPLDAACMGTGACGAGTVVCSPLTLQPTCSTNPDAFLIFNGKELCDGLDNDCNGATDDNLSFKGVDQQVYKLGQSCPGVGECAAGKVECGADKQVVCSTQKGGSGSQVKLEVCDGKDNNCDGKTDEGLGVSDSTCKQTGVCASDKLSAVCTVGKWFCDYSDVPGYQDNETLCDGVDNDCDGETDEGYNIQAPCDGPDGDQCQKGVWVCKPDGSGNLCIETEETDISEVCDGQDNDCDGQTDEDFTYGDAKLPLGAACDGVGACGQGKVVCSKLLATATCSTDPDGTASQAKTELCDGVDNDCDGQTDNGLKYQGLSVGAPCSGVGECGLGVVQCNKGQAVCSTNPDGAASQAKSELCNSKDDNCDGLTDENLDAKKSSCNQIGVCAVALKASCIKGLWKCAYDPSLGFEDPEVSCDNVDNNCNGVTDDPYPTKGKACDGPDADQCKTGIVVCSVGKKDVECNEPISGGSGVSAEVCDGKDNDCDGQVDETFTTLGQACDGSDADFCPNGVLVCKADGSGVVCGDEFIKNLVEVCDFKDNDCNGATDEGLGIGDPCDGADADSCKNGTWSCGISGKVVCENEPPSSVVEVCDNKDNDCDGVTDEGFEQKGQKCDVGGDIDSCATGSYQCTINGALACIGDVACVGSASCKVSASPSQLDQCVCGSQSCNINQGNTCTPDGKCLCGLNQSCSAPKVCSGSGNAALCK